MNIWGVKWRSENKLDGKRDFLVHEQGLPVMFKTRSRARAYINARYGYIKYRQDLKQEPHGWKMPIPAKIKVTEAK